MAEKPQKVRDAEERGFECDQERDGAWRCEKQNFQGGVDVEIIRT